MEWVETTGKTIEEAKEAALDELGVDEQDAEFEVLEEPKVGLFGRVRSEGRIRARVRPTTPRAKDDRRDRRRRPKSSSDATGPGETATAAVGEDAPVADAPRPRRTRSKSPAKAAPAVGATTEAATVGPQPAGAASDAAVGRPRTNPSRRRSGTRPAATVPAAGPPQEASTVSASNGQGATTSAATSADPGEGPQPAPTRTRKRASAPSTTETSPARDIDATEGTLMDVALDEQGKVAEQFLLGLLDSFGLSAQVAVTVPDDDTVDIQLTGGDLGLLIGPKGATLLSIQDLTRTVVQRRTNAGNGRIFIDVSGYRQKRNEALSRFARKVAADVLSSQTRVAMEPMSAPDRKTVHDAITDIDGVETASEGEDALRHVVVLPVGD